MDNTVIAEGSGCQPPDPDFAQNFYCRFLPAALTVPPGVNFRFSFSRPGQCRAMVNAGFGRPTEERVIKLTGWYLR